MLQISGFNRILILATVLIGLMLALPNGFYTRVESHNDALAEIEAQGETPERLEAAAGWPSWMPSGLVNLGLDLRGGAHLLAEVQLEDVYADRMTATWPGLRDALREERTVIGGIRRVDAPNGELRVRIAEPAGMGRAIEVARGLARPVQGLTGVGQVDLEVTGQGDILILQLSEAARAQIDELTVQQTLEIIRRRVDEVGTREPTIQRQGNDRVIVQVPGLGSAEELKALIGTTAKLTFNPVIGSTTNPDAAREGRTLVYPSVDPDEDGLFYELEEVPVVTGQELTDARPDFDQFGRPAVGFQFNPTGARAFCAYTSENIGAPFAIVLDEEVISAPVIQDAICGGSGIITGNFSVQETNDLAVLLRAGALPAELTFLQERTIGPELGQDSIDAGTMACIVAFIAVLVFMALSYGRFGLFANVALIINVGLIFGILSLLGATLTLPGIAGIVLTIGMAVDANVLIFERIREELKTAKGPARAIELGYEKALSAIVDANITTFLTAGILFAMGAGPVRGFSVTLAIGIITSVFTAIFVTRLLVVTWFEWKRPKTVEV